MPPPLPEVPWHHHIREEALKDESITTHDIRKGDVVWTTGLRLLVLDDPHETNHPINEYSPTLAVNSRILNWDKVKSLVGGLAGRDAAGNRYWRIQGNGLARWTREVQ